MKIITKTTPYSRCCNILLLLIALAALGMGAGISSCSFPALDRGQDGYQHPQIKYFRIFSEVDPPGSKYIFAWGTTGADSITIEPAIVDPQTPLPPSGKVEVKDIDAEWYYLFAETSGVITSKGVWIENQTSPMRLSKN